MFQSTAAHDIDLTARREPGIILASAIAVEQIPTVTTSSLYPRPATTKTTELIAGRCDDSLPPNSPFVIALL